MNFYDLLKNLSIKNLDTDEVILNKNSDFDLFIMNFTSIVLDYDGELDSLFPAINKLKSIEVDDDFKNILVSGEDSEILGYSNVTYEILNAAFATYKGVNLTDCDDYDDLYEDFCTYEFEVPEIGLKYENMNSVDLR